MNPFDNGGYVLIEMIKISNDFDKAEINKCVSTPYDATINFLFPRRTRQF